MNQSEALLRQINEGNTKGLLFALCIAIGVLGPALVWMLRTLLAEKKARHDEMTAAATAHAAAMDKREQAHTAKILELQARYETRMDSVQNARVEEATAFVTAANTLERALDTLEQRRGGR